MSKVRFHVIMTFKLRFLQGYKQKQPSIGLYSFFSGINKRTSSFKQDNYCMCRSVKLKNLEYCSLDQGRTKHNLIIIHLRPKTVFIHCERYFNTFMNGGLCGMNDNEFRCASYGFPSVSICEFSNANSTDQ